MKVVAVYTGSVVVDYVIEPDTESGTDSSQQLRALTSSLNTLVTSGNTEVFGAPVLSASTDGAAVIEDPTYNPAARPVTTTPITAQAAEQEEEKETTVTISDEVIVTTTAVTTTSLIGIVATIALIIVCCFGCGSFIICTYQISKASKQVTDIQKKHLQSVEMRRKGVANASESQIEIDQQYAINPEEMDIDIFSKKRTAKVNNDDLADGGKSQTIRGSDVSERYLIQEDNAPKNSFDDSVKKPIVAKLKPLEH